MSWIESHQALARHPKILHLSSLLKIPLDATIGRVHLLWWWCLDYALDGRLDKHQEGVIELACNIPLPLLREAGLVDEKPFLRIHDWWDYAGRFIKIKYKDYPEKSARIQKQYYTPLKGCLNTSLKPSNQPTITNQPTFNQPTKEIRRSFSKPTPEEVSAYAKEINFNLEGQKFCDYYESKGWVVGRSPMKNWKACVRTWKSNGHGGSNGKVKQDGFATAKPGKYPD